MTKKTKTAINEAVSAVSESIKTRVTKGCLIEPDEVKAFADLISALREVDNNERAPVVGFLTHQRNEDEDDE